MDVSYPLSSIELHLTVEGLRKLPAERVEELIEKLVGIHNRAEQQVMQILQAHQEAEKAKAAAAEKAAAEPAAPAEDAPPADAAEPVLGDATT